MNRTSQLALFLFTTTLLISALPAQIPGTLAYQGMLSDSLGAPKPDGSYTFTFRLYDSATGGTALWTEAKDLDVDQGLFYTHLGDKIAFPASLHFDMPYWLGIKLGTEPELAPRIPLASVGYSFTSLRADSAQYADTAAYVLSGQAIDGHSLDAADGNPVDAVYVDSVGNVGIGTNTPATALDVNGTVTIAGGLVVNVATKTAAYTATTVDRVILCNPGTSFTVTLPAASSASGLLLTIKHIGGANTVTIDPNSTETIETLTTYNLDSHGNVTIVSDGTSWWLIAEIIRGGAH